MFYEKIALLNETIIDCLNGADQNKIISAFTKLGIKILDADFGYVWLLASASKEYKLAYKSPETPYIPQQPRKNGRNFNAINTRTPNYVSVISDKLDTYGIAEHMKSFVIIPIIFRENIYGTIVFCFKKTEPFSKEKRILCEFIGSSVAQAMTIYQLLASEQERAMTEFLAEATHELRTPLAIIRGNVDLALKAQSTNISEITRTLNDINYEVNHMSSLVSDLALLVHAGGSFKRKLESHDVVLKKIIERAVQRLAGFAKKKEIAIHVDTIPDVIITGDELYFDKMFGNILRNSITYGKKNGSVTIHTGLTVVNQNTTVHVDVADNGIGIPKADIPKIFERFYRAENAREINHEGTGLGLAIVKFIAEAHGGSVSLIKTEEGKGTTFRLSLPVSYRAVK